MRKVASTNSANLENMIMKCGMAYALTLIGGRWKVGILWRISLGPIRYNALRDGVAGISERMLSLQLKELERDGLISKIVYGEVPPRVEYELTEMGKSLKPVLQMLSNWGDDMKEAKGLEVLRC